MWDVDDCPNDSDNDIDNDGICGDVDDCPNDSDNDIDNDGICADDEIYGCDDETALNYDPAATEDDGSCYYTLQVDISLHQGPNLVSFYALPDNLEIESFTSPIANILDGIITESSASYLYDDGWIGSLQNINPTNGYWLIMNNDGDFSFAGYPIGEDLEYFIHEGGNLISFPSENAISIGAAIPDEVEGSFLGIIGEGVAASPNPVLDLSIGSFVFKYGSPIFDKTSFG